MWWLRISNSPIFLSNINLSLFPDQKYFVGRVLVVAVMWAVHEGQEHHHYHGRSSSLLVWLLTACRLSLLLRVWLPFIYGAEERAPQTTPFMDFTQATHASDCQSHTPEPPDCPWSKPENMAKIEYLHIRTHIVPGNQERIQSKFLLFQAHKMILSMLLQKVGK